MNLINSSEPWAMTASGAASRQLGRAALSEMSLRNALEKFSRDRYPDARLCHEMVMGAGKVRADMVAIGQGSIAAFEIKGEYDDMTRIIHQVAMYSLCVPETWMVVHKGHAEDCRLIRYLLPTVGLLVGGGESKAFSRDVDWEAGVGLICEAEAVRRDPVPKLMLEMLWADELAWVCQVSGVLTGKRVARANMIHSLMAHVGHSELQKYVCAVLRSREALWRADESIDPQADQWWRA